MTAIRSFETPREGDLGLRRIGNGAGLSVSVLPNGCLFAIEHQGAAGRTLVNQIQGSPLDGGIGRLFLRIGPSRPSSRSSVPAPGSTSPRPRTASSGRARSAGCATG